jgi:hypothetical protein
VKKSIKVNYDLIFVLIALSDEERVVKRLLTVVGYVRDKCIRRIFE